MAILAQHDGMRLRQVLPAGIGRPARAGGRPDALFKGVAPRVGVDVFKKGGMTHQRVDQAGGPQSILGKAILLPDLRQG